MAAPGIVTNPAAENNRALDWLNFFLADVKDGLGPFLAIFLMSSEHWNAGQIGFALTIGGIATVVARGPAGALVDAVRCKRSLIGIGAAAVACASIAMALDATFWSVAISQGVSGIADAVFPLAVTAISLGIVGRKGFTRRVGRNEAWNHAGNVATAIAAGIMGYLIAPGAVLWMVAALAAASCLAVFRVDGRAIDHDVARGDHEGAEDTSGGLRYILRNKQLLWFTAAITLFHFANAAMLPLAGEKLSQGHPEASTLFMAACIIAAQAMMVPMAILVGHRADRWGRKPIFLAGFAVLPLRGVLFSLANGPYAVIAIQLLDGVGAGIFGALFYIVVADFTRGSGRYNFAQGVAAASWGLGAALSNSVAGLIVDRFGFAAAFLFLAACAGGALAIYGFFVPESRGFKPERSQRRRSNIMAEKAQA
ncbi:MAG: MFS transporter [Rhodomicrobium sp.]